LSAGVMMRVKGVVKRGCMRGRLEVTGTA
jgi:hypothetical protein